MKKILIFLIALIVLSEVKGQVTVPPGYSGRNTRENILASAANALNIPAGDNATLKIGQWVRAGGFYLDTTGSNKGLYYYMDGQWIRVRDTLHDGSGGGGSGIREVIAGYGLTQINDSTFQFSTALRDSIIGLISAGSSINISDSITSICPTGIEIISEEEIITSLTFGEYYGFPSITKTKEGTLLLHYYFGYLHGDSGTLRAKRSYDYGQTYTADTIFEAENDSNWRSWEVASLWQNDKTQAADTIITQTWTESGHLYFWTSVDDGMNWSARQQIIIPGRKVATQGKVVKFKGKWVMPVYFFTGAATQSGGVIYSTDAGATWSAPVLFDSTYGKPSEIGLIIKGDSLIAFARTETPNDTAYRYASFNVTTWGPQRAITVPLWLAGKPAVHRMDDGRILLNARMREIPAVTPDNAHIYISNDDGFTFESIHTQIYDWNYGSFEYIGGDLFINEYGARITSGHNAIIQTYFNIPRCQIFVDGVEVEKPGNPLASIDDLTIPGVNNDFLFSDGNGAAKVVAGFGITGSKTNLAYVATTSGGATNSQLVGGANSANVTGGMAVGPGADATATFAQAIGTFTDVSGQSGTGVGYSNTVTSLRGIGIGYNNTVSHTDAMVFGAAQSTDKTGQVIFANATGINEVIFGKGSTSTQPEAVTIRGSNASGTDVLGAPVIIQGGRGTGNGAGGPVGFNTSSIGASGSTLATAVRRMTIQGDSVRVLTNFFLERTTVGDQDDSILVKGADKKVYTISQNDFAASVNDTITILTPTTGHQLAVEIAPDTLFIKSLVAGTNITLTDNGDSTITIDASASGETNTASNLGGGLANWDSKSGVDLRFNTFAAAYFNLASNVITIDTANMYPEIRATIPAGGGGDGGVLYIGKLNNVSKSVKGANIVLDSLILQSADALYPGLATTNQVTSSLGLNVDGQGGVVSTGSKGFITIPYNCTILNWFVSANVSGSIQFDIKRSGTSIVGGGGNKPLLSSAISGNAAVSGWTSVAVTEGDILEWVVDSATTIGNATVTLKVIKL